MKELVTKFLEDTPLARERKNRARAIWRILETKYQPMESMSLDKFTMFQPEMDSISRYIRMIQEDRVDLRGKDYSDKDKLEAQTLTTLGYQPKMWQEEESLEQYMLRD